MNYVKGSFTVLPNKDARRGLNPYAQVVFSWICDYADERGKCFPSVSRLADDCGCSKDSVRKALQVLEAEGFIKKNSRFKANVQASNQYQIKVTKGGSSQRPVVVGDSEGGSRSQLPGVVAETDTELNPIGTQPNELNSEQSTHEKIVAIIDAFSEVNPTSYKRWYANKTQRAAIIDLLGVYDVEKLVNAVHTLPITNGQAFFPEINTPVQLRDKWSQLIGAYKRKSQEKKGVKII